MLGLILYSCPAPLCPEPKAGVDHPYAAVNTPACWKHIGFQVLELNKVNVTTATAAELPKILEMGGGSYLHVVVEENPLLRELYMPLCGVGTVEQFVLPSSPLGIGVQFGGAKDAEHAAASRAGIFIAEVEDDSPASALTPRLVGKQVLMANGHDMTEGNLMAMLACRFSSSSSSSFSRSLSLSAGVGCWSRHDE